MEPLLLANLDLVGAEPHVGAELMRSVRHYILASCSLVGFGFGLQVYCVTNGWYLLWKEGLPLACGDSRGWLLLYLVAVTQPISILVGGPLLAVVTLLGHSMVVKDCSQPCPQIDRFMREVAFFCLLSCEAFVLAALLLWCARWRLSSLWRTANEVSARGILAEAALVRPEKEAECIICLGGGEETSEEGEEEREKEAEAEGGEQSWRRLHCGHSFHEECLLEWLLRAQRCPLCSVSVSLGRDIAAGSGEAAARHDEEVVEVD